MNRYLEEFLLTKNGSIHCYVHPAKMSILKSKNKNDFK